ncbi:MAG: MIP family channel protein [Tepidisphaeraceae bacterium]
MVQNKTLFRECIAESIGTFLLVFFGTGAVFVAVLTGALQGLFQVAIVWGLAITLAIYATAAISGTHINPAVTIAALVWRQFPRRKVLPYIVSQIGGAFSASAVLFSLFCGVLAAYEQDKNLVRGQPGSEASAMVFGEYFPNPAVFGTTPQAHAKVSHVQAMAAEAIGTAILVFFIFALTDSRNRSRPDGTFFALFVGLTITILIAVIAPLTQAGFNPARDFGPRVFAYFAGWGSVAIPGPRGGFFTVFILSPIVGGVIGGGIYDALIRPGHAAAAAQKECYMHKSRYIMIGGFLGAGKTTAMVRLAEHLAAQGKRVGLITNDQSVGLVDTNRARAAGFAVEEITGGCFCCRFDSLITASEQLTRDATPDVIIAEPVGSCTDLKATVSYPLRQLHGRDYEVAPLSVLVDPFRCMQVLGLGTEQAFTDNVMYVYRKQLEEAEVIAVNKIDLLDEVTRRTLVAALRSRFPHAEVLEVSCKTGQGLAHWFDHMLAGRLGHRPAMEVDYDQYADGEARLGWLNVTADLTSASDFDGNLLLAELAGRLRERMATLGIEIAHLKMTLAPSQGVGLAAISLTRTDMEPQVTDGLNNPVVQGRLTINLRAETDPQTLKDNTLATLPSLVPTRFTIQEIHAFRPGRPNPTHRLSLAVV